MKKLYKSRDDKVLSGVMGGLGEYFDRDPVLFRLLFILITIATGVIPGLIGYVIAAIIVPVAPRVSVVVDDTAEV